MIYLTQPVCTYRPYSDLYIQAGCVIITIVFQDEENSSTPFLHQKPRPHNTLSSLVQTVQESVKGFLSLRIAFKYAGILQHLHKYHTDFLFNNLINI